MSLLLRKLEQNQTLTYFWVGSGYDSPGKTEQRRFYLSKTFERLKILVLWSLVERTDYHSRVCQVVPVIRIDTTGFVFRDKVGGRATSMGGDPMNRFEQLYFLVLCQQ
jgi:hypothetical protein